MRFISRESCQEKMINRIFITIFLKEEKIESSIEIDRD